ncbi:alpha/beta hydrolase [Dysgonomonas sp. OttesenSCG-928-M03]|nr:alpha/beta hydrolase [Dysgonomonas sp. OttesenSCG-928-M03]
MNGINAQTVIPVWEGNPPTDNGLTGQEVVSDGRISDVSVPEMIVYLPDEAVNKKMAVIICPGGGYARLAMDHEGHQFAKWLRTQGITGIILKYRMPNKHKTVPLEDFQQAMRYVRSKAVEWNIVREDMQTKIGVAGFSAGGHLASTASTHYASDELRPDFSILFYPVITMGNYTHEGSRNNLLGENPSANDVLFYSNETRVDNQTPPAILLLSDDDKAVPSRNSVMYYNALKEKNVPATMYIFPEGGHGWGMRSEFKYHNEMLMLLKMWLEQLQ